MNIVRRNGFDAERFCKRPELWKHFQLFRNAVVLQFNIEILAEHRLQAPCNFISARILSAQERLRNVARKASRQADQPFMMRFKKIVIDARFIIESVNKRFRGKIHQIPISGLVLCKENQMRRIAVARIADRIVSALGDIGFHAENRFDPFRLACAVKVDHAVHHAVIRNGKRGLPKRFCALHEFRNARRAVEKTVLRMNMQMNKRFHIGLESYISTNTS